MRPKLKLYAALLGIALLALGAGYLVFSKGHIDLSKIKIHYTRNFPIKLGLDLQGGSHLVYKADFKEISKADQPEALRAVRDTVERRVNSFGVAEPQVLVEGQDRIIVELPGIKDIKDAIDQIGQTPFLEFRTQSAKTPQATVDKDGKVVLDPAAGWDPTGLSGKQLARATADMQQGRTSIGGGSVVVRLEFNDEGKKLFGDITSKNVGKPIAIFLDGKVISAPTVQTAITDGTAIITGNFTVDEAKQLATRLNSGALPVPIQLVSQQTVGATLGKESVHKSLIAGFLGLLLIILFMIMYYRFPGLLAVVALGVYVLVSIAVLQIGVSLTAVLLVGLFFFLGLTVSAYFGILAFVSYLLLMLLGGVQPVTLTLAGIAGFILSVGMAVDANILIFERVKEEIRAGKDTQRAVADGFDRAWLSIRDSNVSSLITTIILYMFGTPSIRGFAITLGIGILISMFTAISVTRTFLKLFLTNRLLTHPWLFGVSRPAEKQV
jgi:protein-export membrane protein SecD